MIRGATALVTALAAAASVHAADAPSTDSAVGPPPIEDYGKLPGMQSVTLSPSGQRFAYVAVANGVRRIVIVGPDGKVSDTIGVGAAKVEALSWAGDDHLLINTSKTFNLDHDTLRSKSELGAVTVVNVNTKKAFGVFQQGDQERVAPFVAGEFGAAQINGHWYGFFGAYSYDTAHTLELLDELDVYRVDLDTGRFEMAFHGDFNSVGWLVSPQGVVDAGVYYNSATGQWTVKASQRQSAVIASGHSSFDYPHVLGYGRARDVVLLAQTAEHGQTFEEVPLAGGAAKPAPEADGLEGAMIDPATRLWIGGSRDGDQQEAVLFDPAMHAKLAGARKAFDGYISHLASYSSDFNRLIVETDGGDDSGTYWLVDIAKHSADPIGVNYPSVVPSFVGPIKMIDYKAADGTDLHGVLTLPPGRDPKNLPLVVMPHGGPEARDYLRFDYWAQAFAARGYAVFQPNFRGSSGYSRALLEAGYGQWGRKMQTDISDGAAELVRQGIADPKRECIVGWSYGGYAAQAGVTVQHGLYRCAVSMAGVADLGMMLNYERDRAGSESQTTRYWKRFMGVSSDWTDAQVRDVSPLKLAAGADAPLLLIHGDQDVVVPIEQSQAMERALRSAGKPVEFVTLPGADHWLLEEDARVAMLKASVAFVMKYDPPDPAPATVAAR